MPENDENRSGAALVSVVIPMFNAKNTIASAINSVLAQDYENIEILVVDDGSTDGSLDLVRHFGKRVRLFQGCNHGPAAARNHGARKALGQWIAFLDSDDAWLDSKLRLQLQFTGGNKWAYCDSKFVGGINDKRLRSEFSAMYEGWVLTELVLDNFIATSTVIIDREIFLKSGGFDESLDSVEDWDLWLRISSQQPVSYLHQSLVNYRVHASSLSRDPKNTAKKHLSLLKKTFSQHGVLFKYPALHNQAKSNSMAICAQIAEEEDNLELATTLALKSACYSPGKLKFAVKMILKFLLSANRNHSALKRFYSL